LQAAGRILLDGPPVRLAGIGAVYQTITPNSGRSVSESILFGHEPHLCGIAIEWRAISAQHGTEVICIIQ
jgi:ABC-type sugar transport system ATPase subunit